MAEWFIIGSSTFLLLCAIVLPIVLMNNEVRRSRSTSIMYDSSVINWAMLMASVLGILGMLFMIAGILLDIPGNPHRTHPIPGWVFIGLGSLFLICTFIVPVCWGKLTNTLAGPSAELEGIGGCLCTLSIAIALGLLSIILLVAGIFLQIARG